MAVAIGQTALRAEVVDRAIKQIAAQTYKFKQGLTISTTAANKNSFWREDTTTALKPLIGGTSTTAVRGLPRGANFPHASPKWIEVDAWVEKYGLEDNIFWEDIISDEIDVQARVLFKLGEGVAKAVDDEIWEIISEGQTPSLINTFDIDEADGWNGTSGAVVDDLMHASQLIAEDFYNTDNVFCFVNPRDKRSIVKWITDKGAQFNALANDTAINGSFAKLAGMTFIESISVTTSMALVMVPKVAATWKQATPLTTDTKVDPFKSTRIRVVERGVTQVTDPNAICLIRGTLGGY